MKVHHHRVDGLRTRQGTAEAFAWRCQSLLNAGFPAELVPDVAADPRLDLHAVFQLLDQGCPPELAIKIVEPLSNEMRS
ncbi:MAG: hypothetical protein L0H31_17100 [Nocardioidaceae bacterium]|nr:hypothetical protein [Nocardioidaceae bacterium]